MKLRKTFLVTTLLAVFLLLPLAATADSIDPATFSATLGVGESVTITKTVTVDDAAPTSGILDVVFLFDTTGSMSAEIAQAKAAASDILSELSGFGSVATGVAYYSEPGPGPGYPDAIVQNLSTDAATTAATINEDIYLGLGGGGGDFPEEGIRSVQEVCEGTTWRTGSTRLIIALGDATFKESDGFTVASAQAAMDDAGVGFIGIDYGYMTADAYGGYNPGDIFDGIIVGSSGLDPEDLVADIMTGITSSYSEYSTVSVSDLGGGMPGVGVDVVAVGDGAVGDSFVGDYDRSEARTFEFEVTFTGLEEGVHAFDTYALVDGGATAVEADTITVGGPTGVPEPGSMLLLGAGFLALGIFRRRTVK